MSEDTKRKILRSAANSSLPVASLIPDPDLFRRSIELLRRAQDLKVKVSVAEEELLSIRDELAAICEAFNLKGFRHGLTGFEYHGYTSRKSLSKERLLALGVSADTIAEAYVDGEPFLSAKITVFDME